MWRDGRVMKSNKQASHGGEVTVVDRSLCIQTLQSANSSHQRWDEELERASKWNNHYLSVEGCFGSQYYCQHRPDEERRDVREK